MSSFEDFGVAVRTIFPALITATGVAVAGGVLGVFVLLKRHSLAGLAIPQAVAVGVAIGFRLGEIALPAWLAGVAPYIGWPTLPPAILAVAASVLLLASTRSPAYVDSLLAACYVGGLAISILIIANAGQHVTEMQQRFVGIDIAVGIPEMAAVTPILLTLAVLCAMLWRRWLLLAQAPAVAEIAGLNPEHWHYAFHALLAAVLMLATNSLGVVMVLTMLFLPAATALPWVKRVPTAICASVILALLFLVGGLILSIEMDWPLSQSVGGVGFGVLIFSRASAVILGK
jgi:ABC-type Mn2+/Zn2+ transport system permease subunit